MTKKNKWRNIASESDEKKDKKKKETFIQTTLNSIYQKSVWMILINQVRQLEHFSSKAYA